MLMERASKAKDSLLLQFGIHVNIGISDPSCSPLALPVSYKQAVIAARNKFHMGMETITVYGQVRYMDHLLQEGITEYIEQLIEQLKLGKEEKALIILSKVFDCFFTNRQINPDDIYATCFEMILVLRFEFVKVISGKELREKISQIKLEDVKRHTTINELYIFIKALISEIVASLAEHQQSEGSAIISKAIGFCKSNLATDITLDIVSEHISMNKSYFSFLFKKETGENFWDYLTKMRIGKAKELLLNTNLKIYGIAETVGYKNASHFGKIFKEQVGVTPAEFKERFGTISVKTGV